MTTLTIPTDTSNPFVEQSVNIAGVPLVLRTRYNQRIDRYFLDVLSESGEVLRAGFKVVARGQILANEPWVNPLPENVELWFMSLAPSDAPASLGEFGENQRVELTVFDER